MADLAAAAARLTRAVDRLEAAALRKLTKDAAGYVAGGAGLERTIDANRAAFDRHRIVQRMLRDVSTRDLSIRLFGRTLPLPFLLAPIGVLDMAHRGADIAAARGAAAAGGGGQDPATASEPAGTCTSLIRLARRR